MADNCLLSDLFYLTYLPILFLFLLMTLVIAIEAYNNRTRRQNAIHPPQIPSKKLAELEQEAIETVRLASKAVERVEACAASGTADAELSDRAVEKAKERLRGAVAWLERVREMKREQGEKKGDLEEKGISQMEKTLGRLVRGPKDEGGEWYEQAKAVGDGRWGGY